MEESKAPALQYSLNLINKIKGRGIKIFLISSRRETLRSATFDNLIKVGNHGWTGLTLMHDSHLYHRYTLEDDLTDVKNYKAEARKRLMDEGYQVWGITGDQWSSFEGLPSAKSTFKIPNSLYSIS
ncbi:Acid phosphatase, class B-like [Dillenia turbinata]|uniref:Acid phosphatase, class B-like n=1 Tax=Dillenia turbinata TaxID=194707 RepID=A0AAN8VPB4_9MAGN